MLLVHHALSCFVLSDLHTVSSGQSQWLVNLQRSHDINNGNLTVATFHHDGHNGIECTRSSSSTSCVYVHTYIHCCIAVCRKHLLASVPLLSLSLPFSLTFTYPTHDTSCSMHTVRGTALYILLWNVLEFYFCLRLCFFFLWSQPVCNALEAAESCVYVCMYLLCLLSPSPCYLAVCWILIYYFLLGD